LQHEDKRLRHEGDKWQHAKNTGATSHETLRNISRMHVQHQLSVIATSVDKHLQHPKKFKLWDIKTSA
jgi:hypothetical protein